MWRNSLCVCICYSSCIIFLMKFSVLHVCKINYNQSIRYTNCKWVVTVAFIAPEQHYCPPACWTAVTCNDPSAPSMTLIIILSMEVVHRHLVIVRFWCRRAGLHYGCCNAFSVSVHVWSQRGCAGVFKGHRGPAENAEWFEESARCRLDSYSFPLVYYRMTLWPNKMSRGWRWVMTPPGEGRLLPVWWKAWVPWRRC